MKVLIADDNAFITGGLEIILNREEDIEVVGIVQNGEEAVDFCQTEPVDIALLDIRMPKMDGVEATKRITETSCTKVIILTTFDDDAYIISAIQNGAKGYLLKNNDPARIIQALRSVSQNQSIVQEEIWLKMKDSLSGRTDYAAVMERLGLTNREKDIMAAVAKGYSNKEIARLLFLSEGTVANHISTLLGKLGLEHRTQLAILYLTGKAGGET
ncbi:response regulator transcription factor [Listeria costaricensis]|uniref:response regulator transcription factor n=1 Tax=Listeria costaricensis TaxID=2026604 RepID=UPI000C0694F3|nr:response regulator transcription factor [Listeria costaricensis]